MNELHPETRAAAEALIRSQVEARLPSQLAHRPLLRWPEEVALWTGIADGVLRKRRELGDCPALVVVGRQYFARPADLTEWLAGKVLPAGAPPARRRAGVAEVPAAPEPKRGPGRPRKATRAGVPV
jgi:hypothetical protein